MYILDRYQKGKHFLGLVRCFSRTLQNAPHNLLIINIIHIMANTQINAICNEQVASTILSVQINYYFLETNVKKYLYIDFRARALFNFNFYRLYT